MFLDVYRGIDIPDSVRFLRISLIFLIDFSTTSSSESESLILSLLIVDVYCGLGGSTTSFTTLLAVMMLPCADEEFLVEVMLLAGLSHVAVRLITSPHSQSPVVHGGFDFFSFTEAFVVSHLYFLLGWSESDTFGLMRLTDFGLPLTCQVILIVDLMEVSDDFLGSLEGTNAGEEDTYPRFILPFTFSLGEVYTDDGGVDRGLFVSQVLFSTCFGSSSAVVYFLDTFDHGVTCTGSGDGV